MEQWICPNCQGVWKHQSLVFRFCPKCGVKLVQSCPFCYQDLPTLSPECPHCKIRLQICPRCFRLFPLRENLCPFCSQSLRALRTSFTCIRGNYANTFSASLAFLDLLPQRTPLPWERTFSPPLSMGVLVQGSLFFVSGSGRLQLHSWHFPINQEFREDLGHWVETNADTLRLWGDQNLLWVWDGDNRWVSLVDISHLPPKPISKEPFRLPNEIKVVGAAFNWLWWERGNQLEALEAERLEEMKPHLTIRLTAPLTRFPVDRFSEAAFVVTKDAVFFADQQGNILRWHREKQKAEVLRKDAPLRLLPIALNWQGLTEVVWVVDDYLLRFVEEGWQEVPLMVRPIGSQPVAMGEGLWLPMENGQRWVLCDNKGFVMAECRLPLQTKTIYAFSAEALWLLQEDRDVVRLFRCDQKCNTQERGVWDLRERPFVFGHQYNSSVLLFILLRGSGNVWAKLGDSQSVG